jgi:hypothetical protein
MWKRDWGLIIARFIGDMPNVRYYLVVLAEWDDERAVVHSRVAVLMCHLLS